MSPSLPALARRWDAWWFAPASPYPLAAFRVLFAAYLLGYLGSLAGSVPVLFSSEGVHAPYLVPDYAPPLPLAWLLYALLLLLCALLLLGYRAAWVTPAILALFLHHYLLGLAVRHSSFDRLIIIFLLVLWPAGADRVWAVSARTPAPPATCFAGRLIRFQCIILYLGAGLWKALSTDWPSGELLHSTLQGVWATPLGFFLAAHPPFSGFFRAASWLVIGFELSMGLMLWWPRTRGIAVAAGIAFHLVNTIVIAVPEFLVCIPPYVFFLREASLRRFGDWISRGLSRPVAA